MPADCESALVRSERADSRRYSDRRKRDEMLMRQHAACKNGRLAFDPGPRQTAARP